jgi:ABC-type transport system involved in multi-copper enzyme maturation permease subunit
MAAMRDRLLISVLAIAILGICLSLISSSSAVVEQNKFAIVYMASSLRMLILAGLTLFVVFFVRRSFDARDIEYLLSRPVSRATLVLSNAAAFSVLALALGGILALVVGGFAYSDGGNLKGILLWSFGVTAEYIILANIALFFAMVLSSPVMAGMAVMGFYALARMIGELLGIAQSSTFHFIGDTLLTACMKIISVAIPRLDLMTQTSWLIYGAGTVQDYGFIMIQAVAFVSLVLVACLIDLTKREF